MSFGFGVGDFLAAAELAKKVWGRVKDSPTQVKDTRQDVEAISAFIQGEETSRLHGVTDPVERARIQKSLEVCKRIVQGLQSELSKFGEIGSAEKGLRAKFKQSVQRLRWDQKETADTRSRVLTSLALLEGEFRRLDSEILRRTNAAVNRTQAGVERLQNREDIKDQVIERQNQDAERQAILNWICPSQVDYADQQRALKKKRQRGIGEWFVESKDFKDWLKTDGSALLCSGRPGVGKTMITSFVVSRVLEKHNNDPQVGVAYIYCQFARRKEQTPERLVSSILRQLIEQHSVMPDKVKSLHRSPLGKEDLSSEDLFDLLEVVLGLFTKRIFIIDALDEIQSSNGARNKFVSQVIAIRQKFNVQLYVTSRVIQDIALKASDATRSEICAREEDIRCSVASILKTGTLLSNRPDLQKRAISRILQVADGIFLLAVLYAKHLASFELMKNLSGALDGLRSTSDPYSVVYAGTMQRMQVNGGGDTNLALTTICWLLLAKRPLRLRELLHALAIDEDVPSLNEKDIPPVAHIIHACAGLVNIDESNNTIGLFHKTFHEYLAKNSSRWFPRGDETIGKTCVSYLSLDAFASGPCAEVDTQSLWSRAEAGDRTRLWRKRLNQYPFYGYASQHWQEHIRGSESETADVVLQFLADAKKLSASCQTFEVLVPQTTGVHIAVRFLLERSLDCYLDRFRTQPNVKDNWGRYPLSYAAELGSLSGIKSLMKAGADPNSEDDEDWKRHAVAYTPLSYAARKSHDLAAELLLDKGASANNQDCCGRDALSYAAEGGSELVARMLLRNQSKPERRDNKQQTALCYAAAAGSTEVVSLLLDHGAAVNHTDSDGRTPLLHAARASSESTISLLMTRGAKVNVKSIKDETPLSRAVEAALVKSVELLLRAGADVDSWTMPEHPLHQALVTGSKAIVHLLVAAGSDVKQRGRKQVPPLAYAAQNGWTDIVRLLLAKGAAADDMDGSSRSVLSYAVESGSTDCVSLLLKHGADINRPNRHILFCEQLYYALGMNTMTSAVRRPANERMLSLLLSRGANPNQLVKGQRSRMDSPIFEVLEHLPVGDMSTRRIIEILLKHGAKVNRKNQKGESVLVFANHHSPDIRDLLRQHGAE